MLLPLYINYLIKSDVIPLMVSKFSLWQRKLYWEKVLWVHLVKPLLCTALHHVNIWNQCPTLFAVLQDFRNSQARNAAGRLEAFHQPLPAEKCPVTGTSWTSSAAVRARPGRHQSHGGQRGQAQTVKRTQTHTSETQQTEATKLWDRRRLVRQNCHLIQKNPNLRLSFKKNKYVFDIN